MTDRYVIQYRNVDGKRRFIRSIHDDGVVLVIPHRGDAERIARRLDKAIIIDLSGDPNVCLICNP